MLYNCDLLLFTTFLRNVKLVISLLLFMWHVLPSKKSNMQYFNFCFCDLLLGRPTHIIPKCISHVKVQMHLYIEGFNSLMHDTAGVERYVSVTFLSAFAVLNMYSMLKTIELLPSTRSQYHSTLTHYSVRIKYW